MEQGYAGLDRRRFERVKGDLVSKYSSSASSKIALMLGGHEFNVDLLDLSEGGMAVASQYFVPTASVPLLRFVLLTRDINIEGRVVNRDMIKTGGYRLGIQFENMNPQDRVTLSNFLRNVSRREKVQELQ